MQSGGGILRNTNKKKGFTLIELLAVIVILAIIALVAIPIILNMISKARKQAALDSTYGYVEALEYNMGLKDIGLNGYNEISDGENIDIEDLPYVKMKGKQPDEGEVTIDKRKVTSARICINGYWVDYEKNTAKIDKTCNPGVKLIEKIDPASTSSTLDSITVPINAVSGTTITAKGIDEDGNEITGTVENGVVTFNGLKAGKTYTYTITATDSSGNETVRKGTLTTVSFNHIDIKQDTNEWAKKKTITITTEENLDGTGTELQYKVGSGNWTKYTKSFEITENTTIYARLKNGDNTSDEETFTITTIDNATIGTPTATITTGGYPIIKTTGIQNGDNNTLKITYTSQEGTSPYYSLDNGTTWEKYTNEVSVNTTSIKAKLKRDVSGLDGEIVTASINSDGVTDALGPEAFDGDETTKPKMDSRNYNNGYIYVDSSMIGKGISVKTIPIANRYPLEVKIYDESGKELLSENYAGSRNLNEKLLDIPANAYKMYFNIHAGSNSAAANGLFEVQPYNAPTFEITSIYPIIKNSGVEEAYNKVKIDYFVSSNQKLYKINDGEWKNYTGTILKLKEDDVLYAKGIDSSGKESNISTFNSEMPTDALGPEAFDGDETTKPKMDSRNYNNGYIYVDSSMIGKGISVKTIPIANRYPLEVKIYDESGKELLSENYAGSRNLNEKLLDIPTNAYKMYFNIHAGSNSAAVNGLFEVQPYNN